MGNARVSKGLRILMVLLAITAAANGFKYFAERRVEAAEAAARAATPPDLAAMGKAALAQQEAEAVKRYPDLPRDEALLKYGHDRARQQLAGTTGNDRVQKAAQLFHGFYLGNTTVRAKWCEAQGDNLWAFMSAFKLAHGLEAGIAEVELRKAMPYLDRLNVDVAEAMKDTIDRDMRGLALQANVPPDQVCEFLNENAEQIVPNIPTPPGAGEILREAAGLPARPEQPVPNAG